MSKTISIQNETYKKLAVIMGKRQQELEKPQSFDSTIKHLIAIYRGDKAQ